MYWKFIFLFLMIGISLQAQETTIEAKINQETAEIDSITTEDLAVFDTIELEDANLLHLNLRTEMEKKYYLWLRKRVRDVWPYVKIAVEEYNFIQDTTQYIHNKRDRKKYIKKKQNALASQFENQLRDMSLSRGQILIKLINRETDKTSFEIIKELRGGFNAFLWNTAGGAYDLDFKAGFDPHKIREDLYIDVILEKDFRSGRLERIRD